MLGHPSHCIPVVFPWQRYLSWGSQKHAQPYMCMHCNITWRVHDVALSLAVAVYREEPESAVTWQI